MPTISTHVDDATAAIVETAAKTAGQRIAPYLAEALRRRLESEGHLPGTPAHDVRAEALAAAEIVGAERVLSALKGLREDAYAGATTTEIGGGE